MKHRLLAMLLAAFVLATLNWQRGLAHESKPCLLNIREMSSGNYEVSWRTPPSTGQPYGVKLQLPEDWHELEPMEQRSLPDGDLQLYHVEVPAGKFNGSIVRFPGLESMVTEVFARVTHLDGSQFSAIVRSTDPQLTLQASQGWTATARQFIALGIEHILFGIDHLLFVLGLLLIVRNRSALLKTITAFTLAHSITLALASLGLAHVPPGPVEASIALSILLLAPEVLHVQQGRSSLTIRYPWAVAFVFGLLHGFGFASGLSLAGIPQREIPLGLLCFNVGVELGQLLFIVTVLLLIRLAHRLRLHAPRWLEPAPAYGIGIASAFWFIQRSLSIFGIT